MPQTIMPRRTSRLDQVPFYTGALAFRFGVVLLPLLESLSARASQAEHHMAQACLSEADLRVCQRKTLPHALPQMVQNLQSCGHFPASHPELRFMIFSHGYKKIDTGYRLAHYIISSGDEAILLSAISYITPMHTDMTDKDKR